MQTSTLLRRSLFYFWRTNLAVVAGVALAVGVLAGALMVGDSVRASLRDLFLSRIGKTDLVISSATLFRELLASDLKSDASFNRSFKDACPMLVLKATVTHEASKRRASGIQVYGVDDRFWSFHDAQPVELTDPEIIPSSDLARELGSRAGDAILLRVEKPSAIPADSLQGRKDDLGKTIRYSALEPLPDAEMGQFSISPSQGPLRAVFVSLKRLQKDLNQLDRINTILFSGGTSASSESDLRAGLKGT